MSVPAVHLGPDELNPAVAEQLARELATSTTLSVGGQTVSLSVEARDALGQILALVAAGTVVEIKPVTAWLTTSEAAAILHVSRPTLVQMLETGLIPYDQPGVHRRVSRAAIDRFLTERAYQRRAALEHLAQAEDPSVADEFVETR
jgi:excisionase family DNA binding protein